MINTETLRDIIGLGIKISFRMEAFQCRTTMRYPNTGKPLVKMEQATPLDHHFGRIDDMLIWMKEEMLNRINKSKKNKV